MEVLAAFIREHSREQWPLSASKQRRTEPHQTRPDVQAAVTVIGRRDPKRDLDPINLNNAAITWVILKDVCFSSAILYGTDLDHVNLSGADLSHADLSYANLTLADLKHANLSGARLEVYSEPRFLLLIK
jgi:uncharacterized protein YjbI with pentapeptide repeats